MSLVLFRVSLHVSHEHSHSYTEKPRIITEVGNLLDDTSYPDHWEEWISTEGSSGFVQQPATVPTLLEEAKT